MPIQLASDILQKKIADSEQQIRQAFDRFGDEMVVAWTGGKDITLVLYLAKRVCDADGRGLPKCFCIDEGDMFDEVRGFLDPLCRDWGVDLTIIRNDDVIRAACGELGAEVNVGDLNERNRREIERLGYE